MGAVDKGERDSRRKGRENLAHRELQFHAGKGWMEAFDEDVWEEELEVVEYGDETKDEEHDSLSVARLEDELEQEERETYLEREKSTE